MIDDPKKIEPMNDEMKYLEVFQDNLNHFFNEAVDINLTNLRQCGFWIRTMNHQNEAAEKRTRRLEKGLPAPPLLICSITNRCNLACKGCYVHAQNRSMSPEIKAPRFEALAREAAGIGTNIILIAGGEPLLRKDILESAARVKETVFPVITNGTLMNGDYIRFFKKNRNLIPVLSIEGNVRKMEERRGPGLYAKVIHLAEVLRRSKMFFGLSMILTRDNFDELTNPEVLQHYHKMGSRLFFFVEFVPTSASEEGCCLTPDQKKQLPERIRKLRSSLPGLYVALPGEEDQYGGCLAAGRGFAHISANGDLEPCPFAPWSDSNILQMPFAEALDSLLLRRIRDHRHLLKESPGGCTLRANEDWMREQLEKHGSMSA
jgi:MoaA/NifB/PqqE/SkfB family radical SAM enzyme